MAKRTSKRLPYRVIVMGLGLVALLVTGLIMGPAKAEAKETGDQTPPEKAAEGISLERLVFARRVEDRKPVEVAERFSADGGRVYAHAELRNLGEPQTVTMTWSRDGRARYTYSLEVGKSRRWRTWSRIGATRHGKGDWELTIKDADGNTLGAAKVTIE